MKRFILKRLANFCIALVGVSVLSFILLAVFGSDPAEINAQRMNVNAAAEQIEATRVANSLDLPLITHYFNWINCFFETYGGAFDPSAEESGVMRPIHLDKMKTSRYNGNRIIDNGII